MPAGAALGRLMRITWVGVAGGNLRYRVLHHPSVQDRYTGWYAGSACRWSTDHRRQKLFDNKYHPRSRSRIAIMQMPIDDSQAGPSARQH